MTRVPPQRLPASRPAQQRPAAQTSQAQRAKKPKPGEKTEKPQKTRGPSAAEEGGWLRYRQQFLGGDEAAYQAAVGGAARIGRLPLPIF